MVLLFQQAVSSLTPHVNPNATPYPDGVMASDWYMNPALWVAMVIIIAASWMIGRAWVNRNRKPDIYVNK
jgi:hypothetical protein